MSFDFDTEKLVDLLSNNTSTLCCPTRISQYKSRIRDETNQEERRKLMLNQQKEKRDNLMNSKRDVDLCDDDVWSEEKLFIGEEMEWNSSIKKVAWHKQSAIYKNSFMFSEWLIDIPNDLATEWICVPCPVGRRNLLITKFNHTVCYSKQGLPVSHFKSILPTKTILDTIYCPEKNTIYVLDVIQWNGMSFSNCQTEFRFFWLNSQFQDNPEYSVASDRNDYPILNLKRSTCIKSEISNLVNCYPVFTDNQVKLDGILFYHKETQYTQGYTPLVGWLKPYMFPEALGIDVLTDYISGKPESYSTFKEFVSQHKEKRDTKEKNKMECEEITGKSVESVEESDEVEKSKCLGIACDPNVWYDVNQHGYTEMDNQ